MGELIEGGNGSTYTTATSLITVNMTAMRNESWRNSSLPANVSGRANAEMVWLPVSESGILVVIGGVINPEILAPNRNLTYDDMTASVSLPDSICFYLSNRIFQSQTSPTFMKELPIYDVASQNWQVYLSYSQETMR
jgi:hypothetical protein